MRYKEALELQNMYTISAQIAKSNNKYDYHLEINETKFVELLKKAFPKMKNNENLLNIARNILND